MTWSYDPAMANKGDQIHFLCGDTNSANPLLQDEEIVFLLTQEGNIYTAAALGCEAIATKLSVKADRMVGDRRFQESQLAKAFAARAAELRRQGSQLAVPFVGGMSIGDKQANEQDTDMVRPAFSRSGFTNRQALIPDSSTESTEPN